MPGGSGSKESPCSARDLGSIPGSGRYPGEGHGYPLQYSCLGKPGRLLCPWDRKESDMTEQITNKYISKTDGISVVILFLF